MSALDGFYATWNDARNTFGEGTPQGGALVDASPTFSKLGEDVQAAAPGNTWTGAASEAYGGANKKHGENLTKLADLDRRLATQLDQAADVVTTGRGNLDAVRQWVTDAANSVPPGKQRDELLMRIANSGLGQVSEIVQTSNDANNTIRDNMNRLKPEFQAIGFGGEFKEAPPASEDPGAEQDETTDEPTLAEKVRAEQDVRAMLGGDVDAASRVDTIIGGIRPGETLNPEEASYLSQLQAQQRGMKVSELQSAKQAVGPHGDALVNSWQLMSNDDVHFPRTPTDEGVGALDSGPSEAGSFDQLPSSIQEALNRDGVDSLWDQVADPMASRVDNVHEVSSIAEMLRDGDPTLQTGTKLDDAMLDWSRETLHDNPGPSLFESLGFGDSYEQYAGARDEALADVFETAGRDHESVSAELSSSSGQQFLTDLHTHVWADTADKAENQNSVHPLLSWIGDDAKSSEPPIASRAADAAQAIAENLSTNYEQYLKPDPLAGATPNSANLNPALIAADAVALEPFQDALVGARSELPAFDAPGTAGEEDGLKAARNIFAVIDSEPGAAAQFNAAAEAKVLQHQQAFAEAAGKESIADTPQGDLKRAAYMLGVINSGAELEAHCRGLQGEEQAQAIYDVKKAGLDFLLGEPLSGKDSIPGYELGRNTIETIILGVDPDPKTPETNAPTYSAAHGIRSTYYLLAQEFNATVGSPEIPERFFQDGVLKSPDHVDKDDWDAYSTALENFLKPRHYGELGNSFDRFYEEGAGTPPDSRDGE